MLSLIIQSSLGFIYASLGEWLIHRYILHGLGKDPKSIWAYHLYDHHAICRKFAMLDPVYRRPVLALKWDTQAKELVFLVFIIVVHWPLASIWPGFVAVLYIFLGCYYFRHRKAHLDPRWAKAHLRWHYDHHLAKIDDGNWGVTTPLVDYLFRTRVKQLSKD